MKLSVAMCTYNGERHLREQLDSIAAQTRVPDELVVCDDGSTDQTVQIVESFAAVAPFRVQVQVNEQNRGSTKNFERAIELCEGDVIFPCDQDDVWYPQKTQRFEHQFVADAALAMVFSNGEVVDERLRPLNRQVWESIRFGDRERQSFKHGDAFRVLLDHNVVTGAGMSFRSEFKPVILPIPDHLVHDGVPVLHDWWAALMIAAVADVAFIDEPLFKYRQHENQQMGARTTLASEQKSNNAEAPLSDAIRRRNSFAGEIQYLRTVRARLAAMGDSLRDRGILTEIEHRLAHLEARAAMPSSRVRRVPSVLRELLSLRYHAYSNGVYSAAKDLWVNRMA